MATASRTSFARFLVIQLLVSMTISGITLPAAEIAEAQSVPPCASFTMNGSEVGEVRTIPCDGTLSNYSKDDNLVTTVQRGTKTAIVAACDDDSLFDVHVNTPVCHWPEDNSGVVCDFDTNAILATGSTETHCPNLDYAKVNVKQGDIVTFYRRYSWHNAEGSVTFRPAAVTQTTQCSDGIDNDGDGFVDWPLDPGCDTPTDNSEPNTPPPCTEPWADRVVSFVQGPARSTFAADRKNPNSTLGDVSRTIAGWQPFFSLGFNGEIVLAFTNFINNGAGNDLTVYEATNTTDTGTLEKAQVYASQDGFNWTSIGIATNGAKNSLANPTSLDLGALPWAKFIKIVDTSPNVAGANDAFDVNAVKALYPGCDAPANISIQKSGPAEVLRGSVATYQLTVTNNGTGNAQNVVVSDTIPTGVAGITFLPSQSDSRCVLQAGKAVCNLGTMTANQTVSLNVSFQIPAFVPGNGGGQVRSFGPPEYVVREAVNAVPGHTPIPGYGTGRDGALHFDNATATAACGFLMGQGAVATAYTLGHYHSCGDNTIAIWNGNDFNIVGACGVNDFIYSISCRSATQPTVCTNGNINNVATVTATNMSARTSNSVGTAVNCPPKADLSIQKSGPSAVFRGNRAIYSVTVTNNGPSAAENVVVTDAVPTGLQFSPIDSDLSCSLQGNNVVCALGTVNVGQPRTVSIAFDVPLTPSCTTSSNVQNRATVSSSTSDPVATNNTSAIVTTRLDCPVNPNLSIQKSGPSSVIFGQTATYVVTVRNTGNGAAQNVTVTDELPVLAGSTVSLVSSIPTQGTCNVQNSTVTCNMGTLAPNAEANVTLFVRIGDASQACPGPSSVSNVASVTSTNGTTVSSNPVTSSVQCPTAECKVRARVNFGFTKNVLRGNMGRTVFLGNNTTAGDNQYFDLIVNGQSVVDSTQPTNVPGIGIKRNANNTMSLVFYGFQTANDTEQVYGSVEFQNARVSSFANDTTWPLEEQGDGRFGFTGLQGPTYHNDEVFFQNGETVVPFAIAENISADKFTLGYTSTLDPNCAPADLSIQKSGPATVIAGNKITYQITVNNSGPSIAQNVIVRDVVPTGLTFSPVGSDLSCVLNGSTSTVECNLGSVAPGPRTVTLAFDTPNPQHCSNTINVLNTATVTSTSQDLNQSNNTSQIVSSNITCPQGNLSITKVPQQTQITRGDNVTYAITVSNNGQGTAQNVEVRDFIPTITNGTVSFVASQSDARCSVQGSTVICALGSIAGGSSVNFQLTFATSLTNTTCFGGPVNLFNTAQVTGTNSNTTQVTAQAVQVQCPVQGSLTIQKTATPSVVLRGDELTYTIDVAAQNAPVDNVVITDTLPTLSNGGLTNISFVMSQGTCSRNGLTITCNVGTVTPGNFVRLTIISTPAFATGCQSTTIYNTARVSGTGVSQVQSENIPATVNCLSNPSLSITKSATPSVVTRGGTLAYAINVTNNGNGPAQNVVVTDNLPNLPNGTITVNSNFSSQGSCSNSNGTITCNLGTINAGGTATVNIYITAGSVNDQCTQSFTLNNTASVVATGLTAVTSTPASATINCGGSPNLSITKTASTNSVTRGGQVTYTVTVSNTGTAAANGVFMNDSIAGLTNGNISIGTPSTTKGQCFLALPSGGFSGVISCDLGTLNPNDQAVITFTLTMGAVTDTCSNSAQFQNFATVTSGNAASKTSSTVSTTVNCPAQPNLTINKTVAPSSITRGGTTVYTITVGNTGQGTAQNVIVTDNVPSPTNGTTVVTSATASDGGSCTINGTSVTCNLGSMPGNSQRTIIIYATVGLISNTCSATEVLHNTATVTATGQNAQTSNSTSLTVACGGTPSLSITKTASTSEVTRGGQMTYTLTVTNTGTQAAQNVVVTDNLPNLSNGSITVNSANSTIGTCNSSDPVTCNIGTLNAGQSATITIVVTVGSATTTCSNSTIITNTASVTSSNAGSQTSTGVQTTVNCPGTSNLSITKTASAGSVTRGDPLTYTITVNNSGNAAATNVTVSDNLPNLANGTLAIGTITSTQGTCTTTGDTINCTIGTVNANSTVTITIPLTVGLASNYCYSSTTLSNVATLFATGMSSKTSTPATTTVNCPGSANLTIQKSQSASTVTRGGTLTYTIVVNNGGTAPATNVVVKDNLPNLSNGSLTVQSAVATIGGACQVNGASVTCNVGTLNQNQQSTITIVVTVGAVSNTCTSSTTIANTSTVEATNMSSQTSNSVTTTVNCPTVSEGEVTISKTDNRTTVAQGETLNYVITLTNTSSQSQTVTVTDSFSTLTTYLSSSDNGSLNGNVVTWTNVTVPANGTKTLTMNTRVNDNASNGVQIINQAYTGTKTATDNTTIQGNSNNGLTLTIEDTPDPVEPCEQIRYTLRLQNNNSASVTTDLTMTFQSNDLDFSSATDGGFQNGNGVRWNNLFVAANNSRTVQATANVDCSANDGDNLRVTGTASNATAEATTHVNDNGNGNNDVNVKLSADESEVQPGDELEYTIDLSNDGNNRRCGDLELTLDSNTSFLDATSNGDDTSSRRVVWDNVCVNRDDEESFRATVRVRSSAEDGDELEAKAEWLNEDDTETTDVVDNNGSHSSSSNDVLLTKSADRFEANPNDEVTYTITLRNDTDKNLSNVRISDTFPSDMLQIIDPAGGSVSAGRIEWTLSVNRNQVRTIVYRGRISGYARAGDMVHNSVIAQGGNMNGSQSASADVRILGRLPQTGAGDYTKDLEDTGRFLSPFRGGASGSGFGGLLAFILSSLGIAGAGMFGKRYFL